MASSASSSAADSSQNTSATTPLIVLSENTDDEPRPIVHSGSTNRLSTGRPATPVGNSPTGSLCDTSNGKSKTCNMTHGFGSSTPLSAVTNEAESSTSAVATDATDAAPASSSQRSKQVVIIHPTESTIRRSGGSVRRSVGDNRSLVKTLLVDVVPCFRTNKVIQQRWQLFLMALMLCTLGMVALAVTFTVWRMKDSFAYALVPLLLGGLFFIPGVYYLVMMCLVMSSKSRFTIDMLPTME